MNNKIRGSAPDFGRLRHKDRPSHSWQREAARIEKSNSKFGPLSGGGKSNLETTPDDGTRPRHQDLFNRHIGTLKGEKTDEAK
jgi:hypothetical protein